MKNGLSSWQREKFLQLFDILDNDGDSSLDENDLEFLFERLRISTGWPEASRVASHVGARWKRLVNILFTAKTHLTQDSWLEHCERFLAKDRESRVQQSNYRGPIEEMAQLLFLVLDRDRNSLIDPTEFFLFFDAIGRGSSAAEESFGYLDRNQDGYLQRNEVEDMALEFFHSTEPGSSGDWLFGPPHANADASHATRPS